MTTEEKEQLIHSLKREAITLPAEGLTTLSYDIEDIYKIIPHRPPFALVKSLVAVNLEKGILEATSFISPEDPIFKGHFPDQPVYPGVMQIEAMGQAGLCLSYFIKNNTTQITNESEPVKGLFTRVHNAGFNKGVMPNDTLTLRVQSIEDDDFMGLMSAQVLINNEIISHSILEVYYP